jgi:hypothetical protein
MGNIAHKISQVCTLPPSFILQHDHAFIKEKTLNLFTTGDLIILCLTLHIMLGNAPGEPVMAS